MKVLLAITLIVMGIVACVGLLVHAEQPAPARPAGEQPRAGRRFVAVDIYVDSGGEALAAYQLELTSKRGGFAIVGVEGGEHAAFAKLPYYDPAALRRDRIIIAAFDTGDDLPAGRTRVARVHVEIRGSEDPGFVVRLDVAASADGEEIEATVSVSQGKKIDV